MAIIIEDIFSQSLVKVSRDVSLVIPPIAGLGERLIHRNISCYLANSGEDFFLTTEYKRSYGMQHYCLCCTTVNLDKTLSIYGNCCLP